MYLTLITDNGPSVLLSAHTRRFNTNQGSSAPKHDLESRLVAQLDEPMKAFSSLYFSPQSHRDCEVVNLVVAHRPPCRGRIVFYGEDRTAPPTAASYVLSCLVKSSS